MSIGPASVTQWAILHWDSFIHLMVGAEHAMQVAIAIGTHEFC